MRSRDATARLGLILAGCLLVWDRQLPYYTIDALHEGQHLAWANCALHGWKPQLDVRTLYGFLQTVAEAAGLKTFGVTVLTWRRYALGLKLLAVPIFVMTMRRLGASAWATAWALAAGLLASTSLFSGLHYDPLRSLFPLAAVVLAASAPATAGLLCGLSFFWSPEFGLAGAAATLLVLAAGPPRRTAWWCGGTVTALLFPLPWARGRWPELLANHVEFIVDRAGGYGRAPLPGDWAPYVLIPVAAALVCGTALLRRPRDPVLAALGFYALACAIPALSRPDRWHLDHALLPLLAAVGRASLAFSRRGRALAAVASLAIASAYVRAAGGPSLLALSSRWDPGFYERRVAAGSSRPSTLPRLAGLKLDVRECAYYERVAGLLACASAPDEPVFVLANEQVFYFLADRVPATSFPLYFTRQRPRQQEELVAGLARAAPRIVLVSRHAGIDRPSSLTHPGLHRFVEQEYEPLREIHGASPGLPGSPVVDFVLAERRDSFRAGVGGSRLAGCPGSARGR